MAEEKTVALALVTQTQLNMLGSSLKVVFRVEDGEHLFAELLQALDDKRQCRDRGVITPEPPAG